MPYQQFLAKASYLSLEGQIRSQWLQGLLCDIA
jgi:hypothetical protein